MQRLPILLNVFVDLDTGLTHATALLYRRERGGSQPPTPGKAASVIRVKLCRSDLFRAIQTMLGQAPVAERCIHARGVYVGYEDFDTRISGQRRQSLRRVCRSHDLDRRTSDLSEDAA